MRERSMGILRTFSIFNFRRTKALNLCFIFASMVSMGIKDKIAIAAINKTKDIVYFLFALIGLQPPIQELGVPGYSVIKNPFDVNYHAFGAIAGDVLS